MNKRYNAGIYVRLSVEDTANSAKTRKGNPFRDESVSIENQKLILQKYAQANGWTVKKVYADDGFSGGNFNRLGFEEMLADAEKGAIDLVLVKDLSRFGREYVDVGHYVENVFPSLNVRFIALMDDIDSDGNMDILPFRSFLNAYYLKDLSRKVKSVLRAKAGAGEYVSGSVAYGYVKDVENPHKLTADTNAAKVVKRIFDLRLEKNSYGKIAATLNRDGVLSPRMYYYQKSGGCNPYKSDFKWSERTVKLILKNEVYIGNTVQMKSGTFSYKNKKKISKPAKDWICTENTHEPIIDNATWQTVQQIDLAKDRPSGHKPTEQSLFSGLLACSDCNHPLTSTVTNKRRNSKVFSYTSYVCSYYKRTGGAVCSRHSVSELTLLRLVRDDIRRQYDKINIDESYIISEIHNNLTGAVIDETKASMQKLSARLSELDVMSTKLYEDRLDGTINLDTFKRLFADVEVESSAVQADFNRLTVMVENAEQKIIDTQRWIANVRSYMTLEQIDRETLCSLIDKIIVGERDDDNKNKNGRQNIQIVYRF